MVRQLFIPILLLSCLITTTAPEAPTAKKNCQSHCGSIIIPYPFGIGKGCFVDEFEVVCTSSTNPTAVLKRINLQVNRIDLYDGTLDVQFPITFWNYGDEKTPQQNLSFEGSPFAFSENKNKFIAVGCGGLASIADSDEPIVASCWSVCANKVPVNPQCNGVGCCKTSIPSKLQAFNASFNITASSDQSSETDRRYAFIVKETWFSQNVTNISALLEMTNVTVALNWGLDASKHEYVEKSVESFSPKSGKRKSTGTGYCNKTSNTSFSSLFTESRQLVCYCEGGFEGNPYLPGGCDDIDECKPGGSKQPCGKYAKCKNTVRGYKCKPKYKNLAVPLGIVSAVAAMLGSRESARVAKKMSNMMRKKKFFKRNGGQFLDRQFDSGEADVEETKLFESEELEKATDSFKMDRVLGQGGQDTVYKGMLRDGNIVAVKKSKIVDESRVEEFINEVVNLSKVDHRNVVKLLGCCLQTEDPLLVYEYVPNGTLYQYIYDEQEEEFPLTWEIRLRIATEIAGALTHLHSSATLSTYRRDISSKNILLDGKYRAKLADIGTSRTVATDDDTDLTTAVQDIGTSRSVPTDDETDLTTAVQGTFDLADTGASRSVAVDDETDFTTAVEGPSGLEDIGTSRSDATDEQKDSTTARHGTFGNLDPKESSQSTKMSDVYGFGVVLVELLIEQKLLSTLRSKQGRSLATVFMQAIEKNKLFNIVDARVKKEGKKASIIAFAKLAKRCLNSNAKKRPAMKEVAAVLEDIRKSEIKASDARDEQPVEEGENGTGLPPLDDLTGLSSFGLL